MATRKLTDAEKAAKIKESFGEMETHRSLGLEQSRDIQQTKDTAQNRERTRLVSKYGESHPRVAKIDRNLKTNPQLFQAYDQEIIRSKTKIPDTGEETWAVYGTVRNSKNVRMPGLTVSLFNEKGQWVREFEFVCTDGNGFYKLVVEDPGGELTKKYAERPLFLRVTNDEKEVLHTEEEPLFLIAGKTDNREILLEGEECGTPPDDSGNENYLVQGTVIDTNKRPLQGITVRAVDQDFTGENPLGKDTQTDSEGKYSIPYKAEDFIMEGKETGGADIIVYILDDSGKVIHKTEPHRNSPQVTTIDIVVPGRSGRVKGE